MADLPDIRQLPDDIANQIAAGEVIERPSAVVKELAENSLDAGALRITVRCEDGGRRLIEVEDDGHGMRPEGLRAALGRHATSKLRTADDLFRVSTLGFRGEALPSIAAVSELELASRPHDAGSGHLIALVGGRTQRFLPCAMSPGTRVSVRNLFWNVPVRLKFLKSEAAESGHVTEQVVRLALGFPRIAFRCDVAGRATIDLAPGQDLVLRVRELFGKETADRLLPVQTTADRLQVSGFIAHPSEAKPTAKRQYVFLNGRHIRDRLLVAAIREGFKGFLEPRLHGVVFLHLDIDPALVDVNVHPTKAEVRFRREGEVFATVARGIQEALRTGAGGFALLPAGPAIQPGVLQRTVVKPALMPSSPAPLAPLIQERYLPATPAPVPDRTPRTDDTLALSGVPARASTVFVGYRPAPQVAPSDPHLPGVRRVLQLNDMYLLIETEEGIRLVDQHALHEKALFLTMDPATRDWQSGGVQERLVPISIDLTAAEVATLEPLLPGLAEHGIEAEPFGPTTVLLRSFPAALRRVRWGAFFSDIAEAGSSGKALDRLGERIAHSAACHGAIKAGMTLSQEEQLELVRMLYRLEHMEHCPHGRPTTLDLSWSELEKRFQR